MISDSLDHCKAECKNRNASRLTYDDYGIGAIEGATLGGYCRCCESRSGPLEPTSYEYPTYVYTFLGKSYIFHILRIYLINIFYFDSLINVRYENLPSSAGSLYVIPTKVEID